MRIRCGMDITATERMMKHVSSRDDAFLKRVYTPHEIEYCFSRGSEIKRAESLAARFAAKEAAAKALGTGVCTGGIDFRDFEITNDANGAPAITISGKAGEIAAGMGMISVSVSLTHEKYYAAAMCTILTDEE